MARGAAVFFVEGLALVAKDFFVTRGGVYDGTGGDAFVVQRHEDVVCALFLGKGWVVAAMVGTDVERC